MDGVFSIVPIEIALDSRLSKNHIRVLITLLSFRAKNTDTVWPSRAKMAARCGLPESRISQITTSLCDLGWLEKEGKGGFSKSTRYKITVPTTVTEPVTVTDSVTVTEPVSKTVTEPVTRIEQTIEQTNKDIPEKRIKVKNSNSLCTFSSYIEKCKKDGVKPIPENNSVFDYAEKVGIHHDWLKLCWLEFRDRYTTTYENKKYKDWPGVFRNAVKNNWFKLWWINADGSGLTTQGHQAQREHGGDNE